jgi:hypothetical protein
MLSEDLEPKGGILSRHRQVRRDLGIREEDSGGVEGIVLRKGGAVGRCGGRGKMVEVYFSTIRKYSEVLRRQTMWSGCYDKE